MLLAMRLESWGHEVRRVSRAVAALASLQEFRPDVFLVDLEPPNDFDLLRSVRRSSPSLPVVVISERASTRTLVDAMQLGAYAFFVHPLEDEELRDELEQLTSRGGR